MGDDGGVLAVGAYRVEKELGRGAFGVVYRAAHADSPDTPVALDGIQSSSLPPSPRP